MYDYSKKLLGGAAVAVVGNIWVTERLAITKGESSEPVVQGYERQMLPITLGVGAFINSLNNSWEPKSLGFALGMALIQTARFVTGCYTIGAEECSSFDFSKNFK